MKYIMPEKDDTLQVEITTFCNLDCIGCFRSASKALGRWENRHMSREMFNDVVRFARPAKQIALQGLGEPTLHPNLPEIVRSAKSSRKFDKVLFYTNGLVRDIPYYRDLKLCGHDTLVISVDSLDSSVANKCRRGTDTTALFHKIEGLLGVYGEDLEIGLVLSRINLEDSFRTFEKLDLIGPLPVYVQKFIPTSAAAGAFALTAKDVMGFKTSLSRREQRYKNIRVVPLGELSLDVPLNEIPSIEKTKIAVCDKPFKDRYVAIDGTLSPCCVPAMRGQWGNARLSASMDSLFSENPIKAWLSSFSAKDGYCAECPFNRPANSTLHLSNSL